MLDHTQKKLLSFSYFRSAKLTNKNRNAYRCSARSIHILFFIVMCVNRTEQVDCNCNICEQIMSNVIHRLYNCNFSILFVFWVGGLLEFKT